MAIKKTYEAFEARGWKSQKNNERMVTIYVQGIHSATQHDLSLAEVVELQELLQKAVAQSAQDTSHWSVEPF